MDKAVLLKGYLPEDDVELPSGTGTVRVRGLSRLEAVQMNNALGKDTDDQESEDLACSLGMIDPRLSVAEVREWRGNTVAADVQAVAVRISELSNLDKGAGKGRGSSSRKATA
jgi:hypothetical protein